MYDRKKIRSAQNVTDVSFFVVFAAKNGTFLEKEFLSKEVSGRKVELDEVTVPAPLLESSSSQKSVPVTSTPISEEVNDDDHVTSDQVTTKPRR